MIDRLRARFLFLLLATSTASGPALAGQLDLTHVANLDVSALNIGSMGDVCFLDGRVWLADATTGGDVFAVNTFGALVNTVDPTIVPGLTGGPDALAALGATSLVLFSSFGQSVAGSLQFFTGQLENAYTGSQGATGADFGSSGLGLWIASGTTFGFGSTLKRIDPLTGAVLQSVAIQGTTVRMSDIAFDPFTGALYALGEDDLLREIDLATGAVVGSQDLTPFLVGHTTIAGGFDFDSTGERLYLATGGGAGADAVVVLDRAFSRTSCGSGIGSFACPCGGAGAAGRGCRNSAVGNGGGLLTTTGVPRTGADTLRLQAFNLVPGTTALFFQGTSNLTPAVFGDGVRCVGGTVIRLAIRAAPTGNVNYPETGEPSVSSAGLVPNALTQRSYQVWYRDAAAFCTAATFNLTNAVEVEWRP